MTNLKGWYGTHGILKAFEEGRVSRPGDISAVKALVAQATPDQKQFLQARLTPYLTPYGRKVIFGKSPRMGALG
ncbi:MAG: hypothetical protein WCK53_13020 [Methanomicrobiales archaeon]